MTQEQPDPDHSADDLNREELERVTGKEQPEPPPLPAPPPSLWDDFKAWVRRELHLHSRGFNEDERKDKNP